jgi:5-hydroxyisourate hydrolase
MARSISTHVLDVELGRPAAGMSVRLIREGRLLAEATTGQDGRIASVAPADLEPGRYTLNFDTGSYFGERPHLFVSVAVDIEVSGEGHQHLPLLVAPYSYTTYQGS